MSLIYLDTLRLNAEISGPAGAPPVVLLHALGTDLTLWSALSAALPQNRVLCFDMRGHGASDVPAPPYAMGALIRDCEKVMEHFALKDAVIVGVSMGGLVAQGLATKRLDLVRALVLSNTATKIGTAAIWQARIAEVAGAGLAGYAAGAMQRILGRDWQAHPAMPRLREMLLATDPQGWIGCASAISGSDFYTPTAALTLPTLVIAGANDGTTPPDLGRETADLIRGSRFELMRGLGHLPMLEAPEAFNAVVKDFLTAIAHA
jgi:3-oxoadipate enol-lactonase